MSKQVVFTDKAVKPLGPYSQAVRAGEFLFISGTVPVDPNTGKVVEGGIEVQTTQVMENIKAILEAAGAGLADLVKVTVHLKDAQDWPAMNEVYRGYFQ